MISDIEVGPRSGTLLVKGKGLKERPLALSSEARETLKTYLQVRPKVAGDLLFPSRTHRAWIPRMWSGWYPRRRGRQGSSSR